MAIFLDLVAHALHFEIISKTSGWSDHEQHYNRSCSNSAAGEMVKRSRDVPRHDEQWLVSAQSLIRAAEREAWLELLARAGKAQKTHSSEKEPR
jgi:hypothetical protein